MRSRYRESATADASATQVAAAAGGRVLDQASTNSIQSITSHGAATDITDCSITFDVPADKDVEVVGTFQAVFGSSTAVTVDCRISDGAGTGMSSGFPTVSNAVVHNVVVKEIIPAGSGTVTRKLQVLRTSGSANYVTGVTGSRNSIIAREF